MELGDGKHTPDGRSRRRKWYQFKMVSQCLGWLLRPIGLYERGMRNALDIRLRRMEVAFDDLPPAFDGYTILHLTDLHVDGLAGTTRRVLDLVEVLDVDICIMTGDYRFRVHGPFHAVLPDFRQLADTIRTRDGIFATLGNHDTVDMVAPLEELGIRILANQSIGIDRGSETMLLTGLDDVHYYYTSDALDALFDHDGAGPFQWVAVHSPEFVTQAAAAGARLYLTGHTHGGQFCLPGGLPILTHSVSRRKYAVGLWQHGAMTGYTSCGVGISALPVRYNNRGEVTLLTLRCKAP